ncbi:TIR domain-containing protein [Phormidesmis sp. 146-35]
MTDSSENSSFIEPFLSRVASGRDFCQDIWIEREVKRQGEGGEVTKANSASQKIIGKQLHTITDLLQDDLDYCFNKGRFIFRFIAAIAGSGKTTLFNYFRELIEVENGNFNRSIVVSFELPAKLRVSRNSQSFHNKFYSYILAETIWKILHDVEIKTVGEYVLRELVGESSSELTQARDFDIGFLGKFNRFTKDIDVDLQNVFLDVIHRVKTADPRYAFIYLIDELDDALREDATQPQQMRAVLKSLTNRISSREYNNEVRLLIYMAGTSDILNTLISSEAASERRFSTLSITLGPGLTDEFRKIREKIDTRIEGAYKNCEGFEGAFDKIKKIDEKIKSKLHGNMRVLGNYCRDYALEVLGIYQEHFIDKYENHFEGSGKQLKELIDVLCRSQWQEYLGQSNYQISFEKLTNDSNDHIFRCYAKLLKDGEVVASAYGGARNYELLSGYVDRFIQLLEESNFKQDICGEVPPDIAFILSPVDCSNFLKRKLSLRRIQFVNLFERIGDTSSSKFPSLTQEVVEKEIPIDINMASESILSDVFRGTNIHTGIINGIVASRPYKDIDDLVSKVKNIGPSRRRTIQEKFDGNEICFRIGVFISYNTQDKTEVDKIVAKLKDNKISYWIDDEILGGEEIRKELEKIIESDRLWAAAIFHGKTGVGPWQDTEISALLRNNVKYNDLIIPVVLKSCVGEPKVSSFLANLKYVDFREKRPDPIDFLIRSIKRERT